MGQHLEEHLFVCCFVLKQVGYCSWTDMDPFGKYSVLPEQNEQVVAVKEILVAERMVYQNRIHHRQSWLQTQQTDHLNLQMDPQIQMDLW